MEVTYVNVPKAVIIKQNVVPKNVNIITKKIKLHRKEPTKMKKKFLSIILAAEMLFEVYEQRLQLQTAIFIQLQ